MTTTGQEIVLMDGTKFTASPLKISLLKPFMKTFTGLEKVADDNDKSMDVLLDCVQIALKQYVPELSEKRKYNFLIIDDDSSLQELPLSLKANWVQPSPTVGLNESHTDLINSILTKGTPVL